MIKQAKSSFLAFPEFISITSICCVTWYFLLKEILAYPSLDETPNVVFALTISHYVLTITIGMCLLTLYYKTTSLIEVEAYKTIRLKRIASKSNYYILKFWLPVLLFAIFQFLLLKIINFESEYALTITVLLSLSIALIILYSVYRFNWKSLFHHKKYNNLPCIIFFTAVGLVFYNFIMILVCGGITAKFDQVYYMEKENKVQENILLEISRNGYILKPQIKSITFQNPNQLVTNKPTSLVLIKPSEIDSCGKVIYINHEIFGIKKTKVLEIPILKMD